MHSNLKSALIGGAVAVAFTSAAAAVAGTGVGGVFNLGQTNTVNATTSLTGATNGAQLSVANTGTGAGTAGISINTPAGKPPIVSTSTTKATKLNADLLDGRSANQLGRVAYKEQPNAAWNEDGRATLRTVTLVASYNGFVTLSGGATAAYFSGCAYCAVHIRFRVDTNADTSTAGMVVSQTGVEQYAPLAHTVTVPVTKGTHTYELIGSWYDINSTGVTPEVWYDATLNAQFIPYNATGTTDVPSAASSTEATAGGPSKVMAGR